MKNYSAMSDFEINKAVAIALELKPYYEGGRYSNNGVSVITRDPRCLGQWNPLREPHQAWSIIIENEISLNSRCANGEWKASVFLGREDIFDNYASSWSKNPLRAAMIVFLMMKENGND